MGKIIGILDASATWGEKRTYQLLEDVFKDYTNVSCYYEPMIGDGHPDFMIFSPTFGILIIEVKDYKEDTIREIVPTGSWLLVRDHLEAIVPNPFDQIYRYWRIINNHLINLNPVPIHQMIIFSNISRESNVGSRINIIKPRRVSVLFKDDISDARIFQDKFNQCIPSTSKISNVQFKLMQGNIIPTSRLPIVTQSKLDIVVTNVDELKLLDKEQEEMVQNVGDGHRLFFGVAGSGKTVLLIARARYLALKHPTWRILILCYNKLLARYIQHVLNPQDYEAEIMITNFHKWAKDIITSVGSPFDEEYEKELESCSEQKNLDSFFSTKVPKMLVRVIDANVLRKYDAILIDEAQDFESSWYVPVIKLLNPDTNSLLITCDGLQGIYARKRFRWSSVGIKAQGRVKKLKKSYRNPVEIGMVANSILPKTLIDLIQTEEDFLATEEYSRDGGMIELLVEDDRITEYRRIIERMKEFLKQKVSIIVLFRKNMKHLNYNHPFLSMMKDEGLEWDDLDQWNRFSNRILVGTPYGTKGLEADIVIIPELDQYHGSHELQLLYVAMTRTIRRLLLTANRETQLVIKLGSLIKGNGMTTKILDDHSSDRF